MMFFPPYINFPTIYIRRAATGAHNDTTSYGGHHVFGTIEMGNVNSSSSADVLPIEYYLSDLACGEPIERQVIVFGFFLLLVSLLSMHLTLFIKVIKDKKVIVPVLSVLTSGILGSTRFMKVARGRNSEGACVWKVFLLQEESTVYEPYRKKVFRIRDALINAPNCCVMKKIYVTPKWAVLIRPFQKQTLCDRLSTRPFIVQQEKMWYIYQLFKGLAQCQKANICHGDLKSQNVLLSSWNWLQITDFAPYKPSYLPHDNPSSFTFFFDTSRHQHCNIAPERFLSSTDYEINHKEKGDEWLFGSLDHNMDQFAAGCVVYELLHESGKPPFSYGELCKYKLMTDSDANSFLERLLLQISLPYRPLLKTLLAREPSMRITAQQVVIGWLYSSLSKGVGRVL
ncbi:hypothetical protein DICVIV_04432 [Dictyocaulus viviparus]|uniref:Protein kinase domain-containing protein n=1 Tax=Dictyocaulus viviparus TaxID=29172 RepID=A0A0D8XZV8_DICVI|nr:hypothetical protein DICVIV_04432 [Dictyocaulus viviparus]